MHQDLEIEHEILLLAAVRDDREMSDYALCHITYLIQNTEFSSVIAAELLGKAPQKITKATPGSWGVSITQSRLSRFVRLHHDDVNLHYIIACLYAFGVSGVIDKDTAKAYSLLEPLIKSDHAFALNLAAILEKEKLYAVGANVEEKSEEYAAKARELMNPLAIYNHCAKGVLNDAEDEKYWEKLGKIYHKLPPELQIKADELVNKFELSLVNLSDKNGYHNRIESYYRERANALHDGVDKFDLLLKAAYQLVGAAASYDGIHTAKHAIADFVKDLDQESQRKIFNKSDEMITHHHQSLGKITPELLSDMSLQELIAMRERIVYEVSSAFDAEGLNQYIIEYNIHSYPDRHADIENIHAKYKHYDLRATDVLDRISQECLRRIDMIRSLLTEFIDDDFRDNFILAASRRTSGGFFKSQANPAEVDQFKNELEVYFGIVNDKSLSLQEMLLNIHEYSASKIDKGDGALGCFNRLHQMMLELTDKPVHASLASIIIQNNLSGNNIELPRP